MPPAIALFAYRRPHHMQQAIEGLRSNPEAAASILYVFSDGAKDSAAQDDVEQVRARLRRLAGFKEIRIVERAGNFGLSRNITEGVNQVLEEHDQIVVVEDDIVAGPHFLRFVSDALTIYVDDELVSCVSGYCYPSKRTLPETFFIRGADCWGWATWRDRWQCYRSDGRALLNELKERDLVQRFDFDGAMPYSVMLEDQIAGRNDSWAVRWHASCFLRGMLTLYPGRSLVENIGQDGSGTHFVNSGSAFNVAISPTPVDVERMPVSECSDAHAAFREFFLPPSRAVPRHQLSDMLRRAISVLKTSILRR